MRETRRAVRVVVRLLLNPPGLIGVALLVQLRQPGEQLEAFRRIDVHIYNADQTVGDE
jgi:hypothetical protein